MFSKLPSELIGIREGSVESFCFDRAVMYFGTSLEAAVEDAAKGAKNEGQARAKANLIFSQWMVLEGETPKGVFRDPAAN